MQLIQSPTIPTKGTSNPNAELSFFDKVTNWFTDDPSTIAGSYGYINRVGTNSKEAVQFFKDNFKEFALGGYSNEKMEEARVSLFRQGILKSDPNYDILLAAQMEYWKEYDKPTWSKAFATAAGLGLGEIIRVGVVNTIINKVASRQANTIAKKEINNTILSLERSGSGLKVDAVNPIRDGKGIIIKEFPAGTQAHGFNDIIDNYAGYAQITSLKNANLYQIEGSLNGVAGRFEWITQNGNVTHRMFVAGGTANGVPIK